MAVFTWPTIQVVLLGLVASSLAQFQSQSFDDFGNPQLPEQQQFQQPQRFVSQSQPQFQSQPQRVTPKIRRPQSHKFSDPQSVTITPSSSQGIQSPQARFPVRQQFAQPASAPRPTVRQHQFESQFVQGVQTPPAQEAFQQQPPQFQSFEPPPAPAPQVSLRTQPREPLEPVVVAPVRARPRVTQDPNAEEVARHQAETAKYSFQSSVTDTLSDTQNVREETRDGLALKGVYSYSDGYFKRTVHYEADENGYRVVKEDVEPIGDGPQEDPNGSAEIRSNVGGNSLQYTITAADINPRVRQPQQLQQTQQLRQTQQQQQFQQRFLPQQ